MRRNNSIIQAAAAAVFTSFSAASAAPFIYDLRFVSGPAGSDITNDPVHQRIPILGVYHVDLWARISGTDGNVANEALHDSRHCIASFQIGGGAIAAGGVVGAQVSPDFDDHFAARNGGPKSITADGIGDWGGTSSNLTDTNYMWSRSSLGNTPQFAGGTVGQSVDANTWEFRIASYDINVAALGTGTKTIFNMVKPNATFQGGIITNATYVIAVRDGGGYNISSSNAVSSGTYSDSIGISFITPEPASIAMISMGAIRILGRRRRR